MRKINRHDRIKTYSALRHGIFAYAKSVNERVKRRKTVSEYGQWTA